MSFLGKIDFYGQLSSQFPIYPLRVVYGASGMNAAAAIVRGGSSIIDYRLYWAAVETEMECYLVAIINSETARRKVEHRQSRGQWGPRDFDKVMFDLPLPRFDPGAALHCDLASAAEHAETIAARVTIIDGEYFTRARKRIRDALRADGVAGEIDELVAALLI
jgi:hypothetical protein